MAAAPYSLTLYASDGSVLALTTYESKASLEMEVLLAQARIDKSDADPDGRTPCRFDVSGVDYNEWRGWIK